MTMPCTKWLLGLAVAVAGIGACDAGEADDVDGAELRTIDENGFRLNGFRLNGFRLNGFRLNGFALTGEGGDAIWLSEIRLTKGKDAHVAAAWLEGSELHVETDAGKRRSGHQLKGAEFVFRVQEDGTSKTKIVRIDGVGSLGDGSDVLVYDLAIRSETGPWQPLCLDHLDEPTGAILLDGAWDPDSGDRVPLASGQALTFACQDAALAKCVEWGYRPWDDVDGVALADYHQTCTRAVRADYCGDGVSHTNDGVRIHVLDELGIQDREGDYLVEAEWGPDGASCLDEENTRLPDPQLACDLPACGPPFASGGLIQTGIPTP